MFTAGTEKMYPFEPTMARSFSNGKTFYVSTLSTTDGADTNEGTDPQYPLVTLTAAIAKCTQRQNDYIFVADGPGTGDTEPIDLNIRNIHIIGLGGGGVYGTRGWVDGATEACFTTSAAGGGTELAGFNLYNTGATDPCILINANTWQMYIHNCVFGLYGATTYGIYGTGASAHLNASTIENCFFGGQITTDGIYIQNVNRLYILNNIFTGYGGVGVSIGTGAVGVIQGNSFFKANAGAEGCAITLGGSTSEGIVTWNSAMEDDVACSAVPYLDNSGSTGATANAWGINYSGKDAVAPTAGG